jgi:exonuclease SbcD
LEKQEIHIVFFSDTHCGFDFPLRPRVDRRHRGEDFFNNFNKVLSYAVKTHVDLVVHGGDLFFRSKLPPLIIDKVYQSLLAFTNYGIPIYIIPGNHERSQLPGSLFLNHPLINVFNDPGTFTILSKDVRIAMSGFPCERDDIKTRFNILLKKSGWYQSSAQIKLLCMHQVIEGASVGPKNYTFRSGAGVIPMSYIPDDAQAILCGHIHRHQVIFKHQRGNKPPIPVIMAGSTERASFAEMSEDKGFYHLVFRMGWDHQWQLERLEFIHLPTRPMVDIKISQPWRRIDLEIQIRNKIRDLDKNAIIRFISDNHFNSETVWPINSARLRQILPATMNFTFSSNLFQSRYIFPR